MAEMTLGTSDRNDPGNRKGTNDRSTLVLDKGVRRASLKAKHLGRYEKLLTQVVTL
jgi:hypothetical protein